MVKVRNPLLSGDVRGAFGKKIIFTRGGFVRRYFKPRNPNSIAQQLQRIAFKEFSVPGLTQEQADILYAAILHLHDDRYSQLGHGHNDLYSVLNHLHDDRYTQLGHNHNSAYMPIVTTPSWTSATLQNSWTNVGTPFPTAAYWKDADGYVYLRGLVIGGTINARIFALPDGFRPPLDVRRLILQNGAAGFIGIISNGDVIVFTGSNQYIWLDELRFRVT